MSETEGKMRAGKPALSRERIELAALALIEESGLDGFSLRKLAGKLGCEAMRLYNYFRNKAELLDALVERLIRSFAFPEAGLSRPDAIRFMAYQWRRIAQDHPNFFPFFSMHRMNSETGVEFLDRVLRVLMDLGMPQAEAARFFRVMNYYLIGATLDEIAGYAKGSSSTHPVSEEVIRERYPALAEASRYFSPDQFDATFEFGLRLIIGADTSGASH